MNFQKFSTSRVNLQKGRATKVIEAASKFVLKLCVTLFQTSCIDYFEGGQRTEVLSALVSCGVMLSLSLLTCVVLLFFFECVSYFLCPLFHVSSWVFYIIYILLC